MTRIANIAGTVWKEVVRRKDLYVLMVLLGALLVTLVSLDVFDLGGVVRYVLDIGLLMAWLFAWILAITVSARQLPQEETRGTVYSLLAKPVTRAEVIVGKWLGAWSVVAFATAVFYALVVGVTILKRGSVNGIALLQGFCLHAAALAVISAIAMIFSARMNADAAISLSFVITGASFLVVPRIPEFLTQTSGITASLLLFLYNILPHFEVFDLRRRIVHDYGPAAWGTIGCVLLYGLALVAMCLILTWLAYRHKRFSRETIA